MGQKYTPDELNTLGHAELVAIILAMQGRIDTLNENLERPIEQIRLANRQRFGRQTEGLDQITGQMSFFNEAEANCDEDTPEPTIEETVAAAAEHPRKPKKKGQRKEDMESYPQEEIPHDVPKDRLDETFGKGCYKSMPDETCWQLRFEPARWVAERHVIKVYVGMGGLHQDEFLRGDRPDTLFRGSAATPSLEAAIINAKYVNSSPLDRLCRDFQTNGLNLSKQTISNRTVWTAERYLSPVYKAMVIRQLQEHVNQCDETPVEVIHDDRPAGSQSYIWVHLTGELSPGAEIIVCEYQRTRRSGHPKQCYRNFRGVLMTDGLEQYHKLAREIEGITNADCLAHARRHFANAIKAIGKGNQGAVKSSVAYRALMRIATIYKLEGALKDLSPEERLKERQASIKPLVEEFSVWVKEQTTGGTVLPRGETAKGSNHCTNQEEHLKVFLTDGEVPIDDSASERALRNFTVGRKNWVTINTIRGAQASAVIYSATETARVNGLNVYYYIRHLLTELMKLKDADGNIDQAKLGPLMPWSKELPTECYSKRRQ